MFLSETQKESNKEIQNLYLVVLMLQMVHMHAASHASILKSGSQLTLLSPPIRGQGFLGGVATPDSGCDSRLKNTTHTQVQLTGTDQTSELQRIYQLLFLGNACFVVVAPEKVEQQTKVPTELPSGR